MGSTPFPPRGPGRPSLYSPELANRICVRLAAGETLRQVCRDDDMPDESTVRGWALDNVGGFFPQYARARVIKAEGWFDDIIEIADDKSGDTIIDSNGIPHPNHEWIARARLRVDTRKWALAKALPKVYGDKLDMTAAVAVAGADEISSPLELARIIAFALASAKMERDEEGGNSGSG